MAQIENADFTNLYLRRSILFLWLLPWVVFLLLEFAAPGCIEPFFHHPLFRTILVILGFWETAGCVLLSYYDRNRWMWLLVVLVFVLPLLLWPVAHPWFHCIIQDLRPNFQQ